MIDAKYYDDYQIQTKEAINDLETFFRNGTQVPSESFYFLASALNELYLVCTPPNTETRGRALALISNLICLLYRAEKEGAS